MEYVHTSYNKSDNGCAHGSIRRGYACVIALVVLFFIPNILFAQQFNNQIKITPLRTINLINPGFELSYERCYGKLATQLSAVYLVDCLDMTLTSHTDYKGYRIALEEKFFFKTSENNKIRIYFSFDAGYNNVTMRLEKYFVSPETEWEDVDLDLDAATYADNFRIKRQEIATAGKFGVEFIFNHFTFDLGAAGFGIAFQDIRHYDRLHPEDSIVYNFEDVFTPLWIKEGRRITPYIPVTFRIGFAF